MELTKCIIPISQLFYLTKHVYLDKHIYNTNEDYPWDIVLEYIEPMAVWNYKKI